MIPSLDLASILSNNQQMASLILLFSGYLYLFYLRSNFELKMKKITQIDILFLSGAFAILIYLGTLSFTIPLLAYSLIASEKLFLHLSFASFLLVIVSSILIKSRTHFFRKLVHNKFQFERIFSLATLVTLLELVPMLMLIVLKKAPETILPSYQFPLISEFLLVGGIFNLGGILFFSTIGFITIEIFSIQPNLKEFS